MKQKRTEMLVGAFVIFGFVLLSLVVFFVSGVYLIRPGYRVNVSFNYVSILDKGAPVRMAGVRVGEVSRVRLEEDKATGKAHVAVEVFIAKGFEIRENYLFSVRGTHILSEPHIEISPQPGNAAFLKEGDSVQGVDPVPLEVLIDRADRIAADLEAMLSRLREAVEDEETGRAIQDTTRNLAKLTGALNRLMSDSGGDMTASLKQLNASTQSLETLLSRMEKGEGTVGKLMTDDRLYQEMREFVQEIKAHPWRLLKRDSDKDKKGIPGIPFL